jgi:hypothetical protein
MKVECHLKSGTVWSVFQISGWTIILWFVQYESANWQLLPRRDHNQPTNQLTTQCAVSLEKLAVPQIVARILCNLEVH